MKGASTSPRFPEIVGNVKVGIPDELIERSFSARPIISLNWNVESIVMPCGSFVRRPFVLRGLSKLPFTR